MGIVICSSREESGMSVRTVLKACLGRFFVLTAQLEEKLHKAKTESEMTEDVLRKAVQAIRTIDHDGEHKRIGSIYSFSTLFFIYISFFITCVGPPG